MSGINHLQKWGQQFKSWNMSHQIPLGYAIVKFQHYSLSYVTMLDSQPKKKKKEQ